MKKNSLILTPLFLSMLYAGIADDYIKGRYGKICSYSNIVKYKKNEKALSVIGLSCVKTDNLYLLPYVFKNLKYTSLGRKNAVYFMTVYMQKKLLYSFLFDSLSLKPFSFPATDYVLSVVFDAIKEKKYEFKNGEYIIKSNGKIYRVYKKNDKMFIDEYTNEKLIKRRWYK